MSAVPRRWWLPSLSGDYLITHAGDRPNMKGWSPLPAIFARSAVEHALSAGHASSAVAFGLYQTLGGLLRPGLGGPASSDQRREVARRLDEAFRTGVLIAYRKNPPLIPHVKKEPEAPPAEPEPVQEDPESYVNVRLVGEDGEGVPGERYKIVLPDGNTREGRLDGTGSVTIRGKWAGQCKVTFPDLDAAAWEPA